MPLWDFKGNVNLSIHDLTRRSTEEVFDYINRGSLSIHDLTRRSTSLLSWTVTMPTSFNSRPHKEVDDDVTQPENLKKLSIHDLTRRSTSSTGHIRADQPTFNSRPHKEVDIPSFPITEKVVFFQFTTSQGGRRSAPPFQTLLYSFNSRPHKEVDPPGTRSVSSRSSFNSRPHKEVDDLCRDQVLCHLLSIHDLTRRSTLKYSEDPAGSSFQFTTSQGGRL